MQDSQASGSGTDDLTDEQLRDICLGFLGMPGLCDIAAEMLQWLPLGDPKDMVAALVRALEAPDGSLAMRRRVVGLLSRFGPQARKAVSTLIAEVACPEQDAGLRRLAVMALGEIGPAAASEAVVLLEAMIGAADSRDRAVAKVALAKITGR